MVEKDYLDPQKVVSVTEIVIGFVLACYAAPKIHCAMRGLEPFGYCEKASVVLVICSLMFAIPGAILWFRLRMGVIAQLLIVFGGLGVWLRYFA